MSRYALPGRGWTIHFRNPKPGQMEDFRKLDPVGVVAQVAHPDLADELAGWEGMPVVNVSNVRKEKRFPQTGFDDVAIGRMAGEYFLNRGFRNFAFLGQAERENARQRHQGFAEVLAERGHVVSARWLDRPSRLRAVVEWECVGENTRNWLLGLPRPVALFCHNDIQAADALRLCAELGISVPEEMAILGVDSDPMFCCLNHPSLSSIAIRPEEVGYRAAARFDAMIAGKGAGADQRVEPAGVEERQSTEVIAIEDEAVAAALRFIRERATEGDHGAGGGGGERDESEDAGAEVRRSTWQVARSGDPSGAAGAGAGVAAGDGAESGGDRRSLRIQQCDQDDRSVQAGIRSDTGALQERYAGGVRERGRSPGAVAYD